MTPARNRVTEAAIGVMGLGVVAQIVRIATDGAVAAVSGIAGIVLGVTGLVVLLVGIARGASRAR